MSAAPSAPPKQGPALLTLKEALELVTASFAVGGSVLLLWAPPAKAPWPLLITGLALLAAVGLRLALQLIAPAYRSSSARRAFMLGLAGWALVTLLLSVCYLSLRHELVYTWPSPENPLARQVEPREYARGDALTDHGRSLLLDQNMDVAAAVSEVGGGALVDAHGLLWTVASRQSVERSLMGWYFAATTGWAGLILGLLALKRPPRTTRTAATKPGAQN